MSGFDVLKYFDTDEELESKGAKMMLPEDPEGKAYLLVRPLNNDDRQLMLAEMFLENADTFDFKKDDEKAQARAEALDKQLSMKVNVATLLVGCEGMSQKYSKTFAEKCMDNSRLRKRIIEFAQSIDNYRKGEEVVKEK